MVAALRKGNIGPISIIMDKATDSRERGWTIVYLRFLEGFRPIVHLFELKEMGIAEGAEAQFNLVMEALEEKGLKDIIKRNLVGFGADGAAVNMGQRTGIGTRLQQFADKPVLKVWCLAHKLQLSVLHAFESNHFYQTQDEVLNSLYYFFHSHSSKRLAALKQASIALNERYYEVRHLFHDCWIPSETKALKNLLNMWSSLVTCLADMKQNRPIWKDGSDRAKYLYDQFINADFLIHLHYKYDLMRLFQHESEKLQQKRATVIGKKHFRDSVIASLEQYNADNFPTDSAIRIFLLNADCPESEERPNNMVACGTLARYELAQKIIFNEIQLDLSGRTRHRHRHEGKGKGKHAGAGIPLLSTIKNEIVNELINQMRSYFPNEIGDFDILLPHNLPENLAEAATYGGNEIIDLANFYGIETLTLALQWKDLLNELIADNYFMANKMIGEVTFFWVHYLINERRVISWNRKGELKWLIMVALALPASSADAERGFSFLTHTKYDRRSSLSDATLKHIIRIRANGPKLNRFDAKFYATQWIKEGHQSAADEPKGPRKTGDDDEDKDKEARLTESALY